ncbi:phage Gp37/Gp68 family protein [Nocardia farcinica]|uniref:phage Gp37/Gp68 family protein n=1 Tax=Nocardia farcinica TaxID=37329 RepID=UPI0018939FF7|nr:phage Gp37/Gp68 family protein [Nocardia farcinica]MBF6187600.1 phage Gp37/Gp68 family protein [Nocardia farcinica]
MSTKIEWTDKTWNPVTGCTRTSEGCRHCYIERTVPMRVAGRRFSGPEIGATLPVQLHHSRLGQPLLWRKPRRIFVCSMADLFHDDVPDEFIGTVFDVMARAPQHTFQVLTKRPARVRALLSRWATQAGKGFRASWRCDGGAWADTEAWPLPNVWLGVSVEDQRWADIRIPALLDTPAAVRFVSAEPLLGPIDLTRRGLLAPDEFERRLDWVIVGGESGRGARPMHPEWARSLRDQCSAAGVPFLFKQWGEYITTEQMTEATYMTWDIEHGSAQYHPSVQWRVGKKRAGRELDGRTWDEFPEVSGA